VTPAKVYVIVLPEKMGAPKTPPVPLVTLALPLTHIGAEGKDERLPTVAATAFHTRLTTRRQVHVEGARAAMRLAETAEVSGDCPSCRGNVARAKLAH